MTRTSCELDLQKVALSYFARVLSEEDPGKSEVKIVLTDMTECCYIRQVNDLTIGFPLSATFRS
jgi:hypothetical protein